MARLAGQRLNDAWGHTVVINNRPGAGGGIAFEMAAQARPDGYTLVLGATNLSVLPSLAKVAYDPLASFVAVSLMATSMNILLVHPGLPVTSVKDLIAFAKARPGELNYASSSIGSSSHLAAEMFNTMAHVKITHVPYKGVASALVDLSAGRIQMMFSNPAATYPHVASGKLRALAVTGDARLPKLPDLPTMAEAALPGFEASTWWGILAPAGTPPAIVSKLNAELARALAEPDMQDRIIAFGAEIAGGPPQRLTTRLNAETPKWSRLVREAHISF